MTKHRRAYQLLLSPVIMIAALILFILDSLNINVTPLVSYKLKETA